MPKIVIINLIVFIGKIISTETQVMNYKLLAMYKVSL